MADDADLWEQLTKGGIAPDSATAIVKSHRGMSDADLWERIVKNGASPDVATQAVHARGMTTPDDTGLSLRNIGRSVTQGATFGFGDEALGKLPASMGGGPAAEAAMRAKGAAFKAQHPIADFLSKAAGGVLAPAAAMALAPEALAGAGGAAALGGATGLLTGAGEADGGDRISGALTGGLLGAAGGTLGYGLAKGIGGIGSMILDRMHPERAVARAASKIIDPSVAARLALVDGIAPGGASIGTATLAEKGAGGTGAKLVSRMLPTLRGVGANPAAGASAEKSLISQSAALDAAKKELGDQMSAVTGDVPVTSELRGVLNKVRDVLGAKTPHAPGLETIPDPNPLGLEKSLPFTFDETTKTLDVQDLREALSRLRFMSRQAEKQGVNTNGVILKDITDAQGDLQRLIYKHSPEFAALDKPYGIASEQQRITDKAIKQVQTSRANHTGNTAYGATAGSLGGSLPKGAHGVIMGALDKMLTNKAGAADAVANLIAKPGGPEMVTNLLSQIPKSTGRSTKAAVVGSATLIPALRGLLVPQTAPTP